LTNAFTFYYFLKKRQFEKISPNSIPFDNIISIFSIFTSGKINPYLSKISKGNQMLFAQGKKKKD